MLTAGGNDYGYERVFERPLRGLGRRGDVLFGITTSGRSPNVVRALQAAREMGIVTVGPAGRRRASRRWTAATMSLLVPDNETARIQECHIALGHAVLELLEDRLVARPSVTRSGDRRGRVHRLPRGRGIAGARRTRGRRGQSQRLLRRAAEAGAAGAAGGQAGVSRSTARMSRTGRRSMALVAGDLDRSMPSCIWRRRPGCGTRWSIPTPMCSRT